MAAMRTFTSQVIWTVVLLMLLITAHGIRLGPVSAVSPDTQQKIEATELREGKSSNEIVLCKDGACSGAGRSVKHATTKGPANSTSLQKASGEGVREEDSKSKEEPSVTSSDSNTESTNEIYPDISDIEGMDYASARRKPPIHN